MDAPRKSLLDGWGDWEFSADLHEWDNHPKVILDIGMRPHIAFHSIAIRQIVMVELTESHQGRMEEANTKQKEKTSSPIIFKIGLYVYFLKLSPSQDFNFQTSGSCPEKDKLN
ncbi:reverse transcriptase [Plakobranchus ocellatus]|uniref:Reverse transcriptase n=1 Tax=Plakobranchus ocellatus TaxID=259542 RepID=A0AAV4AZZ7_9GAST|nr:reverse transcriptase [Plakobranchus ocellatus]